MSISGITFIEGFVKEHLSLFNDLQTNVIWDERMAARKTASYGVAYNYSQIEYPYQPLPESLKAIAERIGQTLGFTPNNCLLNYYLDGSSSMGFHADQTDILVENTGVVIVSLGVTRTLSFRKINDKQTTCDYDLVSGSLLYMDNEVQRHWQHAIPKDNTTNGRISLTFREIAS